MFNVADNFTRLRESYSSLKIFLCLLKSLQAFGNKMVAGKKQSQYTHAGAESDPLAWFS
jgi:hypothetical protein